MIGDDRRGGYRRWRTDQLRGVLSYDVRSIIVSDEDPIFNRIRPKYVDPDPPNNVSGAELLSWFICEIYVTHDVGSDEKKINYTDSFGERFTDPKKTHSICSHILYVYFYFVINWLLINLLLQLYITIKKG